MSQLNSILSCLISPCKKVFLTVTFSILSILNDHDLFGSDIEQDCSYTVFAVFFLTLTKHLHVKLSFDGLFVSMYQGELKALQDLQS